MNLRISPEQIEEFKLAKAGKVPHYTKFYGMDGLFKNILGVPHWVSFDVHLEHGIIVDQSKPDQYLSNTKSDLIFVDNSFRKNLVSHKKNVFVLGSLFMRYRRKYKFKYNPLAKGTIVFPTHSSHHLSLEMNWDDYVAQLKNLPSQYHPITICMYWLDILKGEHRRFEEVGFDVISNGHMFDQNYAYNFYTNIVKFKFASGNEPGSFLFYAVEMGMPFFIYGPEAKIVNDGFDLTAPESVKFDDIDYARKLKQAFAVDLNKPLEISPLQLDLVKVFSDSSDWIDDGKLRYLSLKNAIKVALKKLIKKPIRRFIQSIHAQDS